MSPLKKHPIISWFAANSVVANILMLTILGAGAWTGLNVRKEGFPAFDSQSVTVRVPIRGGTPENVERGVAIKIEESLESVNGIEHIRSVSSDNVATVTVEAREDYPIEKLLNDVKIQVDAIPSFPESAENPVVTEKKRKSTVMWVELYGDADEAVLKEAARKVRDALLGEPAISLVNTFGSRDYEISIEPSEQKLQYYNLTFAEVARAITNNSIDVSGGVVRSERGDISLRSREQAYVREDFLDIPVRTNADGTRILVRDVAEVRDAFVDQEVLNRFRNKPTVSLKIVTEGTDDIVNAVKQARALVEDYTDLPEGVQIASWLDGSKDIKDRLKLLYVNGGQGVLYVLIILMLFLNFRLAFWVALGIPVSLCGALFLFPLPGIDLSLNVISAFGFLVVLGIVVDDAIVIGESVYSEKEKVKEVQDSERTLSTTVRGVSKVVTPATFGVITTVAAFLPLTQVSGRLGNVFGQIATVVVFCLIFSLIESKLIMPAHLAHLNVHKRPGNRFTKGWVRFQKRIARLLQRVIDKIYSPFIRAMVSWRYAVFSVFIAIFAIVVTLFPARQLRFVFFPSIFRDNATALLELEQGQSVDYLHENTERIAEEARKLGERYNEEFGHNPFLNIQISASSNNKSSVAVELTSSASREFLESKQIVSDWRKAIGPIAGARSLSLSSRAGPPGGDVSINLEGENLEELKLAADELKTVLAEYDGVFDVYDTFDSGQPEILYSITPAGQAAQLTKLDLASNVRNAFFGSEAQRIQRGRDEVRVMVRYPIEQRGSIETLRDMRVRTVEGATVPFSVVAETEYSESLASIERYDNKRVVSVEASVDKAKTSSGDVVGRLKKEFFPKMKAKYPAITLSQGGEVEQRVKSMASLKVGFLFSIILIYILISIPLKSYLKPLIIMSVIPFGIIGALMGHYIMGIPVSILSVFGILALSGVVVNDSLVYVCHLGDLRKGGMDIREACWRAGADRFRAILLTSLTTFFGLAPLLFEKEVQAQFLKPMAASLAFGILFATMITLILLPMLILIAHDIKRGLLALWNFGNEDEIPNA